MWQASDFRGQRPQLQLFRMRFNHPLANGNPLGAPNAAGAEFCFVVSKKRQVQRQKLVCRNQVNCLWSNVEWLAGSPRYIARVRYLSIEQFVNLAQPDHP